jgi:hypothetical protein
MKSFVALACALFAAEAFATGVAAPAVLTVTGTGSNTVSSSTGASSYVAGAGSSLSKAFNTQSVTAFVSGAGSYSSKPGNAFVSVLDCAPAVKVNGVQTVGSVLSAGGVTATGLSVASNVSTGTGVGSAAAAGTSFSTVAGSTKLVSPNMTLTTGGDATVFVGTSTGVVGTNASGHSAGSIASSFKSTVTGSLFSYNLGNTVGDVKNVTSNSTTYVGGIPVVTSACGVVSCVKGNSVSVNATVEGAANAAGTGVVNATVKVGQ